MYMKYDLSFLSSNFDEVVKNIEKSIKLLDYDCKKSVCILRGCCQIFVNIIGKIK